MDDVQLGAINAIEGGENVLITGAAGRGKSYIVKHIVDDGTLLCAPTGISALNIGGATCHSTFGIAHGIQTPDDHVKVSPKMRDLFSDNAVKRIIFDEVFFIRPDILDCIDKRLRLVKGIDEPFGGVQVVLTGDGMQLAPFCTPQEKRHYRRLYKSVWCFDSNVWNEMDLSTILLEKCYRQDAADQVALLDAIRTKGKYWEEAVERLNQWCYTGDYDAEQTLTLCNYKQDSSDINDRYFEQMSGTIKYYYGKVSGKFNIKEHIVDQVLALKEGARVVVRANHKEGLYKNGQRGVIVGFDFDGVYVDLEGAGVVKVVEHKWENIGYKRSISGLTKTPEGTFTQIPLSLGWSITCHSAQGLSLDNCAVNLGRKTFAAHQAYVSLSRIRNLKRMVLTRPIRLDDIIVDPKVVKFYDSLKGG